MGYSFAGNEITRFAERLPAGVMGSLGTIATTYHRAYGTVRYVADAVLFIYGEFRVSPATFEGDSAKSRMLCEWEARDFRPREAATRARSARTLPNPRVVTLAGGRIRRCRWSGGIGSWPKFSAWSRWNEGEAIVGCRAGRGRSVSRACEPGLRVGLRTTPAQTDSTMAGLNRPAARAT